MVKNIKKKSGEPNNFLTVFTESSIHFYSYLYEQIKILLNLPDDRKNLQKIYAILFRKTIRNIFEASTSLFAWITVWLQQVSAQFQQCVSQMIAHGWSMMIYLLGYRPFFLSAI